jgi:hypothetical protein
MVRERTTFRQFLSVFGFLDKQRERSTMGLFGATFGATVGILVASWSNGMTKVANFRRAY